MEKRKVIAAFIGGFVAATVVFAGLSLLSPRPAEAQAVVKWEYTGVTGGIQRTYDIDQFNDLGKKGWECFSASDNLALFKRRK